MSDRQSIHDRVLDWVHEGWLNVWVALMLTFILVAITLGLPWIHRQIGGWLLMVAILVVCAGLFYARHKWRLGYGLLEILIGGFIVYDLVVAAIPSVRASDEAIFKLAGGMYLAIRGMDNSKQWYCARQKHKRKQAEAHN